MFDCEATVENGTPAFVVPNARIPGLPPFAMMYVRGKGSEAGPFVVLLPHVVLVPTVTHDGGIGVCATAGFQQANRVAPASATKLLSLRIIGSHSALLPCECCTNAAAIGSPEINPRRTIIVSPDSMTVS